jgi:hypothetical protein
LPEGLAFIWFGFEKFAESRGRTLYTVFFERWVIAIIPCVVRVLFRGIKAVFKPELYCWLKRYKNQHLPLYDKL